MAERCAPFFGAFFSEDLGAIEGLRSFADEQAAACASLTGKSEIWIHSPTVFPVEDKSWYLVNRC